MAVSIVTNIDYSIFAIGVDQGIANCGIALVELTASDEVIVLKSGTIKTSSDKELSMRISTIYQIINQLCNDYNVSILGCEKLFFSPAQKSTTNGKGRNKSASIVYTNMATGVLYLLAGENHLHIKEFVPGTVKKYVAGHGRASKEDVKEAVIGIVEKLDKAIETEHEADAIAIGITAVKFKKELMKKGLEREEKPIKPKKAETKEKIKRTRKKKGEIESE